MALGHAAPDQRNSQEATMTTINPSAASRGVTAHSSAESRGVTVHSSAAEPAESDRVAAAALLRLIWGVHVSRAVYAAAELGIADLLAEGPASSEELARVTRTHEPSLYRVLRLLAALGVFDERHPRCFSLTVLGERLRSGQPAGMRSWATFLDALGALRPFEHILDTIKTGRPGFDAAFGMGVFDFLAQHPENAATFDAAMSERTAAFAPSVAGAYDFSDIRTVVDVGGGQGTLLAEILRKHGHLHGVLLETPTVAARAEALLDATDIADRSEVLAGNFFEQVPERADCYLLANVLHDWDDARATEILRNCRRSMARAGKVLIIERLIPEDGSDAVPALLSDINMLVITGGQERTNDEYSQLLSASGLKLGSIQPVAFPYGVIEGLAA
jgi:SAM-dependent methyltransferase